MYDNNLESTAKYSCLLETRYFAKFFPLKFLIGMKVYIMNDRSVMNHHYNIKIQS